MEIIYLTKFTMNKIENDFAPDVNKKICIHFYADCSQLRSPYEDKKEPLYFKPNSGVEKMYFSSHEEREYYFYTKNIEVDLCSLCDQHSAIAEHDSRLKGLEHPEIIQKPRQLPFEDLIDREKIIDIIPQPIYTVLSIQELEKIENPKLAFSIEANNLFISKNKFLAKEKALSQFLIDSRTKFVVKILLEEQYFISLAESTSYKKNCLEIFIPKVENNKFNRSIIGIDIERAFYK
jgi:hypothetical protein